jgi:hypothetical protein
VKDESKNAKKPGEKCWRLNLTDHEIRSPTLSPYNMFLRKGEIEHISLNPNSTARKEHHYARRICN